MIMDTTNWHWQQWYFIVIWLLSLVLSPVLHGKPKTGKYNGFSTIVSVILAFWILYGGGFFK